MLREKPTLIKPYYLWSKKAKNALKIIPILILLLFGHKLLDSYRVFDTFNHFVSSIMNYKKNTIIDDLKITRTILVPIGTSKYEYIVDVKNNSNKTIKEMDIEIFIYNSAYKHKEYIFTRKCYLLPNKESSFSMILEYNSNFNFDKVFITDIEYE